jgi:hypothetical protein
VDGRLGTQQEFLEIVCPLCHPVDPSMQYCRQSVARKPFGMRPDILPVCCDGCAFSLSSIDVLQNAANPPQIGLNVRASRSGETI